MDATRYRERKAARRKWKRLWGVSAIIWFCLSWTVIGLIPLYISWRKIHTHSNALRELTEEYDQSIDATTTS